MATLTPSQADRAVGAVVASAAGDALGAGYEFGPALPPDRPVHMQGGGGFGWEPGEWTDDTQMATAILSTLVPGPLDVEEVAAGFLAWYRSGPADVGNQTRSVLSSAGRAGDLAEAAAAFQARHPDAAGNGSLMRTGPVALAALDDVEATASRAAAVSDLTHPHPDCRAACVLWSVAIGRLVMRPDSGPPEEGWFGLVRRGLDLVDEPARCRWSALLDEAERSPAAAFARRNGWVVDALRCALAAIAETPVPDHGDPGEQLRLALEHAVRQGGDADTVAAIAGSLLGAAWGAEAVPGEWMAALHGVAVVRGGVERWTGESLARWALMAAHPERERGG